MKVKRNTSLIILKFFALPLNVFSLILASVLILAFFVLSICFVNVGYAAGRDITLLWDESIDAPYLQSYKVYYYTTSANPESLNTIDYAVSYTLVDGNPISLNPQIDPKPITIDKTNTQITLHFSNDAITYYFVLTAVDTRGLESIPTPEVFAQRTGSIVINGGAVATNNSSVTISLSAAGSTQMQFSNDNISWSTAEAYATTKQWQLTSGEGVKTIYVKFKDSLDVWSPPCLATITLDSTPPTVAISNPSVTTTTSGPVTYTVTYAGANAITLSSANVTLLKSGTADGAVAVSGTGNTSRMVTISGITGTGSLGIAIAADTASDAAGNQAGASGNSATFNANNQALTLAISNPSVAMTTSGPVTYTVTYTGANAITLSSANVTLIKSGTANGTVAVSGTGNTTRTVTISGITGNGTLGVSIAAGTASDAAGNLAVASGASATVTVDNLAPTLAISNPSTTTTTSGPVTYTVTYTGANAITLTSANVTLIKSGTANGTVAVSGTGNTSRTVTISNITGSGSLGIAIAGGTASDAVGNQAGASGTSVTFSVENQQAPVYVSSTVTQGNIPGLSVIVVNSANVIVAVCDVEDNGTWVSQLLPAGQYDWYIVYGNLISAKNATTFNTALLKSISGTITGLPVGGGAVTVRSVNGNLQKTIAVPAEGAYTVTNLVPASDYQVSVVAENIPVTYYDGKTNISEASYVNISSANAMNINFTLTVPDSHITGTINDLTGSVAGLAVYAYEVNTSAITYTRVLFDGTYDLKVKAGVYKVFVIKANDKIFYFYNEDSTPTQNEAYALARTITTAGQTIGNTNINITEGTQVLQGKVTYRTANGDPVANVLIVASTQMEKSLAITAIDGSYTISGLQNGTTYTVSMKTLTGNYPIQTASIVAGTDTTKDFIIGIGAVLSGTITSQADPTKKVAGALVYIKDQTTGLLIGGRVYYSGADGTYSIYDNQSGNYTLEVFHPNYRSYSANVVIGASDVSHDVAMETGASFKGTVKDISGNPLSGATVIAATVGSASIYSTTNSAGSYNIYGLDPTKSDYTITAQRKDYDRQILTGRQPSSGGTTLDFTLYRPTVTYQVSGIVITSDNNPVQNATVLVSSSMLNFSASTTTAADGSYAVSGLINTGNYTITVLPSGNLPLRSTTFTVNNADVSINFTIALGNQIGGYLFGSPAFPIGKDVYVFLYQGTQYIGYTKAIAGTFTFQGLMEANNYKILATAQGYANQWYIGQSDIATANTIASGNVSVNLTLNAAP